MGRKRCDAFDDLLLKGETLLKRGLGTVAASVTAVDVADNPIFG